MYQDQSRPRAAAARETQASGATESDSLLLHDGALNNVAGGAVIKFLSGCGAFAH
jgi:hypothetical protein